MVKSIAIIVVAAQGLPDVVALRCASLVCWDLKPRHCCATGSCNIFCCNCDGRCVNTYGLLTQMAPGDEALPLADFARDGNLTLNRNLKLKNSQKATGSRAGI